MKKLFPVALLVVFAALATAQNRVVDYPNRPLLQSNDLFSLSYNAGGGTRHISFGQLQENLGVSRSTWTMVVIPDTQYISQMTNGGAESLTAISNFVAVNKTLLNIRLVTGEGDIVDDKSNTPQWTAMQNFYSGIQSLGLPVVIPMGNHDINSLGVRNNTIYNTYFPTTFFTQGAWIFKDAGASENAYLLQTNNGTPRLFISLEWAPRTNTLDWVTNVLTTFSNHSATIITHIFVSEDRALERADSIWNQTTGYTDSNNATNMWERWFKFHPNLRMILNGHAYTAPSLANVTRYGVWGNKVHMMCFNHQDPAPNQTNLAFVRVIQFDENNNVARVRTYNAYTGLFYTNNSASQFSMDFDDSNFPEEIADDLRVRSLRDANFSIRTPNYQWSFRTDDAILPWGSLSALELRAGSHDSVYSNNVALRMETNGLVQMRNDIVSPVMDQVLYFPLDEGFGSVAWDKVRGARAANAWPWGSTNSWITGAIGGAFLAAGQLGAGSDASILSLTNDAATYGALTSITVSAWIKFGALGGASQSMIVSKFNGSTDGSWALKLTAATTVEWTTINALNRDDFPVTVPDLSDRLWHHVVATFDGTQTKNVYLDGVLMGTDTSHTGGPGVLKVTTHDIQIGEYVGDAGGISYAFNGGIDEVRIFARPITATEVLTLYRMAKDVSRLASFSGVQYYSGGPNVWPTRPVFPGAFFFGYSNGFGYALWSTNGGGGVSTSWTKTNLLGPN